MRVIVFEDSGFKNLYPLTYLHPSYAIKCGAFSILETLQRELRTEYEILLHCRNYMSDYIRESYPGFIVNNIPDEDMLFINGRFLLSKSIFQKFASGENINKAWKHGEDVVIAYAAGNKTDFLKSRVESLSGENTLSLTDFESAGFSIETIDDSEFSNDVIEYKYPWDVFKYFEYLLERDIMWKVQQSASILHAFDGVKIISREDIINVYYGAGIKFYPNVVIDCTEGGVVIDNESIIEPFVFIKGPAYIGKKCTVKTGARIYGPGFIGDESKVAGEISSSIFHSYVNKQHDGFIGNSYICPMVNLGADTVTSNLKNNYSGIKMSVDDESIDTGMMFLGSIIGDHSKFGINTMLNTGSRIGIFANVFGAGFPPKEIKSFSWNEAGKKAEKYDIEKALDTAEKTMSRRHLEITPAYEALLRKLYEETSI